MCWSPSIDTGHERKLESPGGARFLRSSQVSIYGMMSQAANRMLLGAQASIDSIFNDVGATRMEGRTLLKFRSLMMSLTVAECCSSFVTVPLCTECIRM